MTLWILFCRLPEQIDTLFAFYARDRAQAEQRATELLQEHPYVRLDLKAYPQGFVIHHTRIPGRIGDVEPS